MTLLKKILKPFFFILLIFGLMTGCLGYAPTAQATEEQHGVWLAFVDFPDLGLAWVNEDNFTKNINTIFDKAEYYKTTDIYFHIRAFDDAFYKSKTFKASTYLVGESKGVAADVLPYDPLQIAINEAHKRGMRLHAWINPYRVSFDVFYDPSKTASQDRVLKAVEELLAYDIDSVHMDDYFYSASKGYRTVGSSKVYSVNIDAQEKRNHCNLLVQKVYELVHTKQGAKFGISPAGNLSYTMSIGGDVETWLSQPGYVDYIVPQIYWTDKWGSDGKVKMFSDRMNLFKSLNKIDVPMYLGLAAYRTGFKQNDDLGWGTSSTNLREQVQKLRKAEMSGYVLFSARNLIDAKSAKEMSNLYSYLQDDSTTAKPIPTSSQLTYSLASKIFNGKAQSVNVTPKAGVGKVSAIYYEGTSGTTYKKTTNRPTNAGSYRLSADIEAGTNYGAKNNLVLGTFKINKADISKAEIKLTIANASYSAKQIKPSKFTYNGVSFSISSNTSKRSYGANKNIGKGIIKITGKGNFQGTKTLSFKILPSKTFISRIGVGTNQIKVSWKKVPAAQKITRYQVRYREKGTTTWKVKTYRSSRSSATIKNLSKDKPYEVQVRSYKTVSKTKYYSTWSVVRTSGAVR